MGEPMVISLNSTSDLVAKPKSAIFAVPFEVRKILASFKSLWTTAF